MITGCNIMNLKNVDTKKKLSVKDIENKIKELQDMQQKLEDEKREVMVREKQAFHCKKCDKIITISRANNDEIQYKICYRCLREMKQEEKRNIIIQKLKHGTVIDIDFTSYGADIQTICIHKDGISYEIQSIGDEQYPSMYIESETEEDIDINEKELKPWMKSRKEQPLW